MLLCGNGLIVNIIPKTAGINPFPNKPWFLRVCITSLLKTLWEKEKLLLTSNFAFSRSDFTILKIFLSFLSNLKLSSTNPFSLAESKICCLRKGYPKHNSPFTTQSKLLMTWERCLLKTLLKKKENVVVTADCSPFPKHSFYTPVKDGTYYVITCGGRAMSPILCPEHISKTMLATVMKLNGWIYLIKAECSAQEP